MKYISLDIETTGLDPKKNQIVEVGAVLDEIGGTTPIEELPKFRAVLLHDEMVMGDYCAYLHRLLWKEMEIVRYKYSKILNEKHFKVEVLEGGTGFDTYYCLPAKFEYVFHRWLNDMLDLEIEYYLDTGRPFHDDIIKINVAGKNPGTFDIPFLEALPGWQGFVKFRRRVLDPASHCILPDDEHIPDLQECLKRCGFGTVKHTAVDDAIDIVRVIRAVGIGKMHKVVACDTCTLPDCLDRNKSRIPATPECTAYITYTAEESSCTKCVAPFACSFRSGRNPNNPCGHFIPIN